MAMPLPEFVSPISQASKYNSEADSNSFNYRSPKLTIFREVIWTMVQVLHTDSLVKRLSNPDVICAVVIQVRSMLNT